MGAAMGYRIQSAGCWWSARRVRDAASVRGIVRKHDCALPTLHHKHSNAQEALITVIIVRVIISAMIRLMVRVTVGVGVKPAAVRKGFRQGFRHAQRAGTRMELRPRGLHRNTRVVAQTYT